MIDYTHSRHVSKNNVPTNTYKCSVQMLITPFMESLVHVRKHVLSGYLRSQAVDSARWNQSLVFFSWSKLLSANDLSTLCFTLLLSSSMKQEFLHLPPRALVDRKWNSQRKHGEGCLMSISHQIMQTLFFPNWLVRAPQWMFYYSILEGEDTEDQNSGKIFAWLHISDVKRRWSGESKYKWLSSLHFLLPFWH